MADVTKTIGTSSRDYSTIALWEADLDLASIYSSGDTAIGQCYNDSAFAAGATINGGATIGLAERRLTVPSSERHDGTAGNGARVVISSGQIFAISGTTKTGLEWLECDGGGTSSARFVTAHSVTFHTEVYFHNLVAHDCENTVGGTHFGVGGNVNRETRIMNCVIYDVSSNRAGTGGWSAINTDHGQTWAGVLNTTVHNTKQLSASSTAYCYGLLITDVNTGYGAVNCISTDTTHAGSGAVADFSPASPSSIDMDHNLSSDTSASGTGSLTSKSSSNQFVSTTGGSEDLHLKSGADAIDAGSDLGTTPADVQFDIDNRDRDTSGDTWDMGADEFVSAGGASPKGPLGMPFHGPPAGPVAA